MERYSERAQKHLHTFTRTLDERRFAWEKKRRAKKNNRKHLCDLRIYLKMVDRIVKKPQNNSKISQRERDREILFTYNGPNF